MNGLLGGGDPRRLHGVSRVVDDVLHAPERFDDLIACLADDDPVVRMRAADAAEKITRDSPHLLAPHVDTLLALAAHTEQSSLRWHLAQMMPRVPLRPNQQRVAIAALRRYLDDKSAIVAVSALQALADLTPFDPSLRRPVISLLRTAAETGSAAIRARAQRLLRELERPLRR